MVIAGILTVHLIIAVQCQAAVNPQTKPTDLGCKSTYRLRSFTPTITIK